MFFQNAAVVSPKLSMLPSLCNFRMALKAALHNVRTGPYSKLAPLHIRVLMVTEQPRVIMWDFRSNTAIAKITKNNTVDVISDREIVTKVTLFEELSSKPVEGKNYIMKNEGISQLALVCRLHKRWTLAKLKD